MNVGSSIFYAHARLVSHRSRPIVATAWFSPCGRGLRLGGVETHKADLSALAAFVLRACCSRGIRWQRRRRHIGRRGRPSRTSLAAILEGDRDSMVMKRWIDELVVAHNFCPWAKPADDAGHLRIVTSTAASEAGVFEDLMREAATLPPGRGEPVSGGATTVVLVCPHVAAWAEFELFRDFFNETVGGGHVLAKSMGLRVVAFHPGYNRRGAAYRGGERVAVTVGDGATASGHVVNTDAGVDEQGRSLIEVRFEESTEEWIIGTTRKVHMPGGSEADEAECRWKDMALRAPRPALHLLRLADLDHVVQEAGGSKITTGIFVRNEIHARELGARWASNLLERCELGNGEDLCRKDSPRHRFTTVAKPIEPGELTDALEERRVVMWCDSDADLASSVDALKDVGLDVYIYHEPEELLAQYRLCAAGVAGVITSMMEGDGRKERGAMNAFGLFVAIQKESSHLGLRPPILAVVSKSADRDEAVDAGAEIVVFGNRGRVQRQMIAKIRSRRAEQYSTVARDVEELPAALAPSACPWTGHS